MLSFIFLINVNFDKFLLVTIISYYNKLDHYNKPIILWSQINFGLMQISQKIVLLDLHVLNFLFDKISTKKCEIMANFFFF